VRWPFLKFGAVVIAALLVSGCVTNVGKVHSVPEITKDTWKAALAKGHAIIVVGSRCRQGDCSQPVLTWQRLGLRVALDSKGQVVTNDREPWLFHLLEKAKPPKEGDKGTVEKYRRGNFVTVKNGHAVTAETVSSNWKESTHVIEVPAGLFALTDVRPYNSEDTTTLALQSVHFLVPPGGVLYLGHYMVHTVTQGGAFAHRGVTDVSYFSDLPSAQADVANEYSPELAARMLPVKPIFAELPYVKRNLARPGMISWFVSDDSGDENTWTNRLAAMESNDGESRFPIKLGVTYETFDSDIKFCGRVSVASIANSLLDSSGFDGEAFAAHIMLGLLFGPGAGGRVRGDFSYANFRNCMIFRGYQLMEVDAQLKEELTPLTDKMRFFHMKKYMDEAEPTPSYQQERKGPDLKRYKKTRPGKGGSSI